MPGIRLTIRQLDSPARGDQTLSLRATSFKPLCSSTQSPSHSQQANRQTYQSATEELCYQHIRQDALLEPETAVCLSPEGVKFYLSTRPKLTFNDPSAGSPTETLLRLLLPLNASVWSSSRKTVSVNQLNHNPRTSLKRSIGSSDGRCVQRAGT